MLHSTWNCPMFIPEHEVVESEEGLWIDGKEVCILHKDFFDNPQLLISKLQKK